MNSRQTLYKEEQENRLPMSGTDKIAVSSWSWHAAYYAGSWSLLDLPEAAVSAGITAIECNDFMLPPPCFSRVRRPLLSLLPGLPPELWRYSQATLRQLSAVALANQTEILTWTVNSDFTVPRHRWPAQQLYLSRGLTAVKLLTTPLLRLNLGGSPETQPSLDRIIINRLAEFSAQSLSRYPALQITVENHWGMSTDIDRHLNIMDEVTARLRPLLRERFGCCFDPANMPENSNKDRWWQALAARANHFHLKTMNFDAAGDDISLPHAYLFELLRGANYSGKVTIEFAGDGLALSGVRKSLDLFNAIQTSMQTNT